MGVDKIGIETIPFLTRGSIKHYREVYLDRFFSIGQFGYNQRIIQYLWSIINVYEIRLSHRSVRLFVFE